MKFSEFEDIFSANRMQKYVTACGSDTKQAMTLYRYNLKLSQEMFTLVSCFEVALRNRIDKQMTAHRGSDWLRNSILPNGCLYYDHRVEQTRKNIEKAYNELMRNNTYSHPKLLAEMEFGVWKYMFSNVVYALMGQVLLRIFPNKPTSSRQHRYDNSYVFQELDYINKLRNRIAHHEPICFDRQTASIDTTYALNQYSRMMRLLYWMGIDGNVLMFGLDHVVNACNKIQSL